VRPGVATRTSGISAEDAERPFKVFASAFPSAPLLLPQTSPDNMPATQTAPGGNRPALPKESPLVILVHGTWATKSLWAMPHPSVSKFVSWIMKHVSIPLDNFRRLPWSGDNQVGARIEAAVRLREMIRTELGKADRLVFIMAHSHGGNVVMNAIEGLTKEEQQSLRLVLMATPFLNNIQRFDIRYLFGLLPSYVQSNLFEIGALGSFVVSALLSSQDNTLFR
jgi:pimeloyl-ACP methyl ester carboxylesterase